MDNFYDDILNNFLVRIKEHEPEAKTSLEQMEIVIGLIIKELSYVKDCVAKRGFSDESEEIYFFKHLKPQMVSKLIYFNSIYKIEANKPFGEKRIRKYLKKELKKLKKYFNKNIDFYKYYRTNGTYLDHKYFVRCKHDIKLSLNNYYFESDCNFSTSHDYKVAKVISNDLVQLYLEVQISNIKKTNFDGTTNLTWTDSKTALIELIYALHSAAVFDNGKLDIKIIANYFEMVFNISLGDFYHTFLEIKNRKINRSKFIDKMRESLIKKMEENE